MNLLADYHPLPDVWDELLAGPGELRAKWEPIIGAFQSLGAQELGRRTDHAESLIRENGMTYNVYGDPDNPVRPWSLDPIPLALESTEWQGIAAGIIQRAQLFNLILADAYGPQQLLQSGDIPSELIFSQPGFAHAFHDTRPHGGRWLHLHAIDLARGPDGRWYVIADRTDAPSGVGYALENRIVISRLFADILHDCRVERLATFFMALRETLRELAPAHRENPRIVLLGRGPASPSHFEDAYLARYQGYTQEESGDLAVRNDRVLLKTLGGLLPVDVILRRVSDLESDPLELYSRSVVGIPGLIQAVRAGQVAVANALGCSLMESPAWVPFLPALCERLLGETLKLPSVPTWWCGQPAGREYVAAHQHELWLQPSYRTLARREWSPAIARQSLEAWPPDVVGQQRITRSSVPVWRRSHVEAAHVAIRAFVVADGDSYTVLPGGLTRVAASSRELDLSGMAGEGSKDLWVLSCEPVRSVTLLEPPGKPIELRRSGAELPSRVADNLFWLGRQAERAEQAARLLRPILVRLTSESEVGDSPGARVLLRALAAQGQIEPGFVVEGIREQMPTIEKALPASVLDANQTGNLRSTIVAVQRNASLVRDRLSLDSWRILNSLEHEVAQLARRKRVDLSDLLDWLNHVIIDLSAFAGQVNESMTRAQGWRFLEIGRRIERALCTIDLIRSTLVQSSPQEPAVLEAVLEVIDSVMTYRTRYLANLQSLAVLDLALTDESNPRSLVYQLVALSSHVDQLPRETAQALRDADQRGVLAMLSTVRLAELEALVAVDRDGRRVRLDRLLQKLAEQLPRLSETISHRYLIHAGVPRQLTES
ncbi:MAG: circularly permuted type 2 ATP-grasp protein [Pirellulaceae bacterium]